MSLQIFYPISALSLIAKINSLNFPLEGLGLTMSFLSTESVSRGAAQNVMWSVPAPLVGNNISNSTINVPFRRLNSKWPWKVLIESKSDLLKARNVHSVEISWASRAGYLLAMWADTWKK